MATLLKFRCVVFIEVCYPGTRKFVAVRPINPQNRLQIYPEPKGALKVDAMKFSAFALNAERDGPILTNGEDVIRTIGAYRKKCKETHVIFVKRHSNGQFDVVGDFYYTNETFDVRYVEAV